MRLLTILFIVLAATFVSVAYADTPLVNSHLQLELGKRYPGARIEITSPIQWVSIGNTASGDAPVGEILSVRVGDENARGEVPFSVQSRDQQGLRISWGRATFAAYVSARVALRRLQPGEAVEESAFSSQELNIAYGTNHEIRGLIMSPAVELGKLETRQTVLEGQPLLSSAVVQSPDVRRGDPVRIELISGKLTLTTQGTASEPGYLDKQVHVVSQKTKRELIGKLREGGIVEVQL